MTTSSELDVHRGPTAEGRDLAPPRALRPNVSRHLVGGFFLIMGGLHLGLTAADAQTYDGFADHALFDFVRTGWQEIVMAEPAVYGLLLMAGEIVLGTALLLGGRAAKLGWIGVIAFHLLLLPFGWGVWTWAVPALAVLVPLATIDIRTTTRGLP